MKALLYLQRFTYPAHFSTVTNSHELSDHNSAGSNSGLETSYLSTKVPSPVELPVIISETPLRADFMIKMTIACIQIADVSIELGRAKEVVCLLECHQVGRYS